MSVEEYRKKNVKEVEIDGFRWTIRKMTVNALAKLTDLYEKEPKSDAELRKLLPSVVRALLPECVVDPKVSLNPSDGSLSVDEIDAKTAMELVTQITEFSGLTGPAAALRERFRQEQAR